MPRVSMLTQRRHVLLAIFQLPTVTELQRFMGMVNQLGKFVSGLADITAPLRQLLRKDSAWYWDEAQ